MVETEAISDRYLFIETEEGTLLLEANLKVLTVYQGHSEDKIITEIEGTSDNQSSQVSPDLLLEDLELH